MRNSRPHAPNFGRISSVLTSTSTRMSRTILNVLTLTSLLSLFASAGGSTDLPTAPAFARALDANEFDRSFSFEAITVCAPTDALDSFFVESDGLHLILQDRRPAKTPRLRPGDRLRVTGTIRPEGNFHTAQGSCHRIEILGHASPPPPASCTPQDFFSGRYRFAFVRISGRLRNVFSDSTDGLYVFLVLDCSGETLYASLASPDAQAAERRLRSLVGADVILDGICDTCTRHSRKHIPYVLRLPNETDIKIIRSPLQDRFAAPSIETFHVGQPNSLLSSEELKLHGIVTARWDTDMILVQTKGGDSIRVQVDVGALPAIGESIEAVGAPNTDLYRINLSHAVWRNSPHAAPLPDFHSAETIPLARMFTVQSGQPGINQTLHGKRIRVQGKVKSLLSDENGNRNILITDGSRNLVLKCAAQADLFQEIQEGSMIAATGICILETDNWQPNTPFPRVRGVFLCLNASDDLEIISRPPWWTPGRFLLVVSILIAIIVLILIWNVTLRISVGIKSRALLREQAKKLEETLKIDERTRLAVELHDSIAQNLTAVSFQVASAISSRTIAPDASVQHLKNADRMLQSSRVELRRCIWDLRSDTLEEPDFPTAIRKVIAEVLGSAKPHVRFPVQRAHISDHTAHAVLSIIRELTANAVRHGHANNVWIARERTQEELRFSVRDDGCGFDVNSLPKDGIGHFGLKGIRERLAPLNGTLILTSNDHGTRAVVSIRHSNPEIH